MKFLPFFAGSVLLWTAGCQITPPDNLNEPMVADAANENATLRFGYVEHADAGYDSINWSTPEVYGPSPAPTQGPKPFPILYRTVVNLSEAQNMGQNTLLFDKVDAQSIVVMANRSLLQQQYIDTSREIFDVNAYLRSGVNEIMVLCIPRGEINPELPPPLLIANGRLSIDAKADSVIPLLWECAPIPGITEQWYNPPESSQNNWTPWNGITRILELHNPSPVYYVPNWITYELELARPIQYLLPRDLNINRTNWNSTTDWYKLEFKLPPNTQKRWTLIMQIAGTGYAWLNGKRVEGDWNGYNVLTIRLDPAALQEGTNELILCNLPSSEVPELISAEIRPE